MTALQLTQQRVGLRDVVLVLLASLALGLAAQISIVLPFTPVPIALHNSLAVFLGVLLGPRRGALAVVAYLVEGAMGLPVFANGGVGFFYLVGPTGGYLLGFVPGAYLAGLLAGGQALRNWFALVAGHAVVYLCGVSHLAAFVGWRMVGALGVYPFLPGCLLKTIALSCGLTANRRRSTP